MPIRSPDGKYLLDEQGNRLSLLSEVSEEQYQAALAQTRLNLMSEDDYLSLILRDGLEEEAMVADAETSFRDYAKMMFPVMEAGMRMVTGWATDAMCDHLQAVTAGEIRNLAIFVPPGMCKSDLTCLYWPTWMWGPKKMAHLRFITASYSEDLTMGTNRRSRALIDSDVYVKWWRKGRDGKDLWGIDPRQDSKTEYVTTKMGSRFATSTGGTVTGKRSHIQIYDDLHSATQAESDQVRQSQVTWLREAAMNRVVDPTDNRRVMIMQRLHDLDAGGTALELGWTILCLPMRYEHDHPQVWVGHTIEKLDKGRERLLQWGDGDPRDESRGGKGDGALLFEERFPEEAVDDMEEAMTDYAVAGQDQQRPVPRGGGMAKADRIESVQYWDVPLDARSSRGWDFAGSKKKGSAFTAHARVGISKSSGLVYLFDGWMDRWGPGELEPEIKSVAEADGISVRQSMPQDPAQAGMFQAHVLSTLLHGHTFEFSLESGSKVDRFRPFASQVNAGKVRFVLDPRREGPRGNWMAKPSPVKIVHSVVEQIGTFPNGKYKDLCDAISRAYMDVLMAPDYEPDIPEPPLVFQHRDEVGTAHRMR